jgi:hypothetical protein
MISFKIGNKGVLFYLNLLINFEREILLFKLLITHSFKDNSRDDQFSVWALGFILMCIYYTRFKK